MFTLIRSKIEFEFTRENWYLNGYIHRSKGPAEDFSNGEKSWWFKGERHRKDGPAIYGLERKMWFYKGMKYREDGPAVEYNPDYVPARYNIIKEWFFNNVRHRDNNLPAIEYLDGRKEYYFKGNQYSLQENGTREFIDVLGRLHRDNDLPAVEYPNGDREWWDFGKRHRFDNPAVIYGNKKFWFKYGEFVKFL